MHRLLAILLLSTSAHAAELPLKSIYSTSPQDGMIRASHSMKGGEYVATYGRSLERILSANDSGASNAFLVDATTIDDAIQASSSVLLGMRAADSPVFERWRSGNNWLVAFLGIGTSHFQQGGPSNA